MKKESTGGMRGDVNQNHLALDKPQAIAKPFIYSRAFDVHRWSDHPELQDCLSDLVKELDKTLKRKRKRKSVVATKFRAAVRAITLDLYLAWKDDPSNQISIARGKSAFGGKSRYRALFLTYEPFIDAFNSLKECGYLIVDKEGYFDAFSQTGKLTRIRATHKLVERFRFKTPLTLPWISNNFDELAEETIILKNADKEKVEYIDTSKTNRMRTNLKGINQLLSEKWIDLQITNDAMKKLNMRMATEFRASLRLEPFIDFTARKLHRVFNNEDWNQGGRFYGAWWQNIPREFRQFITIDGKPTVELDYSGMHLVMLYAQEGLAVEGDAYKLDLDVPRDAIKLAFNMMINADKGQRINPPLGLNSPDQKPLWLEVQRKLLERHHPIAKYIGSGYGLRLQRTDADIAEEVMLHFLASGYACLPVHDSFLVHRDLETDLEEVMLKVFEKKLGKSGRVKKKDVFETVSPISLSKKQISSYTSVSAGPFDPDISEYSGHETRLTEWWEVRAIRQLRRELINGLN